MAPAKADQRTDDAADQPQHAEKPPAEAPVAVQEPTVTRPSRDVKPPERLIEQI